MENDKLIGTEKPPIYIVSDEYISEGPVTYNHQEDDEIRWDTTRSTIDYYGTKISSTIAEAIDHYNTSCCNRLTYTNKGRCLIYSLITFLIIAVLSAAFLIGYIVHQN